MAGAPLVNCDFERAHLASPSSATRVVDCRLDGAQPIDRPWYRAKVTRSSFRGAVFGNAAFDKAVFLDCDFRAPTARCEGFSSGPSSTPA
ncbi:MAG: pentapeptide repeat-containing protein [Kofleriaceae bacterium]|nr:pentapeptide repeat-containing protein [Kofleriaceae bacterium]